jgi:predicted metal-dependent HD superfamily phosphohydrolase
LLSEHPHVLSFAAWKRTCEHVGLRAIAADHQRLLKAWSGRARRYHTLDHLAACLRELEANLALAQQSGEVALALWFHDAVYSTYRADNEDRSAALAETLLANAGASAASIERVQAAILATRHSAATLTGDQALVVDIDLSILGQPAAIYAEFESKVRAEYWWVPVKKFRAGRTAILRSFLERSSIYQTEVFRTRYEVRARENLTHAIAQLGG